MAIIAVEQLPSLEIQRVIDAFEARFAGKYDVYATRTPFRDFVVRASEWTAVGVRVRQQRTETEFIFTAFTPSLLRRALPAAGLAVGIVGAVAVYVGVRMSLRSSWKALEQEVATAIREECSAAAWQLNSAGTASRSAARAARDEWLWTGQLALVALLFSVLTTFIAQNFVLVEVRLLFASMTMRLAWSLLLAAVLGFLAGVSADRLRRPPS